MNRAAATPSYTGCTRDSGRGERRRVPRPRPEASGGGPLEYFWKDLRLKHNLDLESWEEEQDQQGVQAPSLGFTLAVLLGWPPRTRLCQ